MAKKGHIQYAEVTLKVPAVPASRRAAANAALEARDMGPNNFSIAVGPAAGPTITHYVCNPVLSVKGEKRTGQALAGVPGVTIVRNRLADELRTAGLVIKGRV